MVRKIQHGTLQLFYQQGKTGIQEFGGVEVNDDSRDEYCRLAFCGIFKLVHRVSRPEKPPFRARQKIFAKIVKLCEAHFRSTGVENPHH
jgi:hypothetical protein